jgi:hypothetical protein
MFVILEHDEDGYSYWMGGRVFGPHDEARRFPTKQEAWEVIADLRQSGYGKDRELMPRLSVVALGGGCAEEGA